MSYRKTGLKDLWYGFIITAYFGLMAGVALGIAIFIVRFMNGWCL